MPSTESTKGKSAVRTSSALSSNETDGRVNVDIMEVVGRTLMWFSCDANDEF